jgi:hypothetical protein
MAKELLMLMEQKQSNLSVAGTFFFFEKKLADYADGSRD